MVPNTKTSEDETSGGCEAGSNTMLDNKSKVKRKVRKNK